MKIRFTRLILVIIASVFLGMCIVWWVQYLAQGKPITMINISIVSMLVLITAILVLQYWENKKEDKERRKQDKIEHAKTEELPKKEV